MGEVAGSQALMKRTRKNSAGFTLMEVVVATSLMALVMTTLFLGMRITANAWRRGEQKLDEHARALSATDVMKRQIAAAVPWTGTIPVGADQKLVPIVAFNASAQEVRFVTRASGRGDRERPRYLADYRVVKRDGRQQLMISETGLTDDASLVAWLTASPDERAALEDVGEPADSIDIAYYHPETSQQPQAWVAEWQPLVETELPRALRVRWIRGHEEQVATFLIAINREPKVRP